MGMRGVTLTPHPKTSVGMTAVAMVESLPRLLALESRGHGLLPLNVDLRDASRVPRTPKANRRPDRRPSTFNVQKEAAPQSYHCGADQVGALGV